MKNSYPLAIMSCTLARLCELVRQAECDEEAKIFLWEGYARGDWNLKRYVFHSPLRGRTAMFIGAPDYTMARTSLGVVDGTVGVMSLLTYTGYFVSAIDWLETAMTMIQLPDETGHYQKEHDLVGYFARLCLYVTRPDRFANMY